VNFADIPGRVLAVFAHPDDPEVACAGSLARWAAAGSETHLIIVNAGEKGSNDPSVDPADLARTRAQETDAAAAVLGLTSHQRLGVPDGELENTDELRATLVGHIRALRPDVVIAPDPTAVFFGDSYVNHHDHRALGWAVLDACAPMAASPLYFPQAGHAHQVRTLLLAGTLEPDTWVDIGSHLSQKVAALRCHATQLGDSADVVDDVVAARAAEEGGAAGVRYAEGFRRVRLGSG
jgi:LmbE family N-acetylglucosaminyl deacetylase